MPHSGEEHRKSEPIGGSDYFVIALRTSGLDDGGRAGLCDFFHAIGKGKNASEAATVPFNGNCAFIAPIFAGIDAAHLPRADSHGLSVAGIDDRIGLHVLANLPCEKQCASFFRRWSALGDDFQIDILQWP